MCVPRAHVRVRTGRHKAPWNVYSLAWSNSRDTRDYFRIAIGSYVEKYENSVHVR